jgi:hypothetical protein
MSTAGGLAKTRTNTTSNPLGRALFTFGRAQVV